MSEWTAALRSEQEKDEAMCVQWIAQHTDAQLQEIWDRIQKVGATPNEEIVLRFAQLGMTHAILLAGVER